MRRFVSMLFTFALTSVSFGDDWPQWLGSKRDGYLRETGLVESFPKDGLKPLWREKVGMGYAGPAVSGGMVYVADRVLADGSTNPNNPFARNKVNGTDRVRCLDQKTGKEVWKHEYSSEYRVSYASGPRCTPTVADGQLFWLGTMGEFFALDAKSGKVLWKKDFLKDYEAELPVWGYSNHPLVDGNNVICVTGGAGGKAVVAFDRKSGKEVWASVTTRGDFGYNPPVIFEVGGKRVLVFWHSTAVIGLDPATGKKMWQYDWQIQSALTAPTARLVKEKLLFLSSFYNGSLLLDIGGTEPKVVWKSTSKAGQAAVMPANTVDLHSIMTTPYIEGEYIYGVCSYGELRCLELMTGKRVWDTHLPITGKSDRWGHAFLIPNGDRTFLFNEKGELVIGKLTPKGYTEVSRTKVLEATNKYAQGRSVVWSHPAFADGVMYARNDLEIVAVSLKK